MVQSQLLSLAAKNQNQNPYIPLKGGIYGGGKLLLLIYYLAIAKPLTPLAE